MIVMKKHLLSRRTFLRGCGVSIALPFLESMIPAAAPSRIGSPRRTTFYFGVITCGSSTALSDTKCLSPPSPSTASTLSRRVGADFLPGTGTLRSPPKEQGRGRWVTLMSITTRAAINPFDVTHLENEYENGGENDWEQRTFNQKLEVAEKP